MVGYAHNQSKRTDHIIRVTQLDTCRIHIELYIETMILDVFLSNCSSVIDKR